MKIRRGITLFVSLVYLMIASSLFAHHGVPNFDMSRTVTVKGVVIDYLLINPHMEMRIKATDDTGNSVEWNVEAVESADDVAGRLQARYVQAGRYGHCDRASE